MSGSDLAGRMSKLLIDTFTKLIPCDPPIGLVGFPETANCGDHATWLGEKRLLKELGLVTAYECSARTYDPDEMRKAIAGGTILMHGGSNFGDRHTAYHEFRLRVLDDFPNNKVIVFPHHVTYLDNDYLQRTAGLIGQHPDVTLFARSLMTQHLLARHSGPSTRIELAPDLAFMLGPQTRTAEPAYDVVWIARTRYASDCESNGSFRIEVRACSFSKNSENQSVSSTVVGLCLMTKLTSIPSANRGSSNFSAACDERRAATSV